MQLRPKESPWVFQQENNVARSVGRLSHETTHSCRVRKSVLIVSVCQFLFFDRSQRRMVAIGYAQRLN